MNSSSAAARTDRLLERVSHGDERALARLLAAHRPYLRQLIAVHLEDGLSVGVSVADVLQETEMVAIRRIDEFLRRRSTSFRLWLRRNALEKLNDLCRPHRLIGCSAPQDAARSDISSLAVARCLFPWDPNSAMTHRGMSQAMHRALATLGALDRDVLVLRHGEGLTNAEVAEVLGINPDVASRRYGRAIRHLCERLREMGISPNG